MVPKVWWASKTIWINIISSIIAVVMAIAGQDWIKENPQLASLAVLILAVLNAILRWVTDAPMANRMFVWLLAACLIFAGNNASADDVAIIISNSKPQALLVEVDSTGAVTVSPLLQAIRPGITPTPPPGPTPTPVLTERGKLIQAAALKVAGDTARSETAKGMAVMYGEIAKLVRTPGQVKDPASLATAVTSATNMFLASRNLPAPGNQWQPVRDAISTQWTIIASKNGTLPDYAVLLDDVVAGLNASVTDAERKITITPQMLQFIMQIIQLILQLLKPVVMVDLPQPPVAMLDLPPLRFEKTFGYAKPF